MYGVWGQLPREVKCEVTCVSQASHRFRVRTLPNQSCTCALNVCVGLDLYSDITTGLEGIERHETTFLLEQARSQVQPNARTPLRCTYFRLSDNDCQHVLAKKLATCGCNTCRYPSLQLFKIGRECLHFDILLACDATFRPPEFMFHPLLAIEIVSHLFYYAGVLARLIRTGGRHFGDAADTKNVHNLVVASKILVNRNSPPQSLTFLSPLDTAIAPAYSAPSSTLLTASPSPSPPPPPHPPKMGNVSGLPRVGGTRGNG